MLRSRIVRAVIPVCGSRFLRVKATCIMPPVVATARRWYSDHGAHDEPSRVGQYLINKDDVLTRVLEVVKNFEKVDASKVTPESHFINDLGLDSLDVVEVVMALEQEFILDIPDHDAEKIQSIQDAVEYIAQNPMAK
jgi:NADH dehydrogenase (ubiquinone) 1 alpha/beta subcomplex 1